MVSPATVELGTATVTAAGVVTWRGATYAADTGTHAVGETVTVLRVRGRIVLAGGEGPQGPQGDPGPQGPQGPEGPQGPAGTATIPDRLGPTAGGVADWNDVSQTGWWMGHAAANSPPGLSGWTFGVVTAHTDQWVTQRVWDFTATNRAQVWVRSSRDAGGRVWSAWVLDQPYTIAPATTALPAASSVAEGTVWMRYT